jgi:hypothetical protein
VTDDNSRPQDQGRAHRKVGRPSAATATLLARYQQAMRDGLTAALDELAGHGQQDLTGKPILPNATRTEQLWALAIKLARELGTEVDVTPPVGTPASGARPRRLTSRRVDFGGE